MSTPPDDPSVPPAVPSAEPPVATGPAIRPYPTGVDPTGEPPSAGSYPGPAYGSAPSTTGNRRATAALVVAIVGLVFSIGLPPLGLVVDIVALVLGVRARRLAARGLATNGGTARAAVVVGWVATALAVVLGILIGVLLARHGSDVRNYFDCERNATTSQQRQHCFDTFRDSVRG